MPGLAFIVLLNTFLLYNSAYKLILNIFTFPKKYIKLNTLNAVKSEMKLIYELGNIQVCLSLNSIDTNNNSCNRVMIGYDLAFDLPRKWRKIFFS